LREACKCDEQHKRYKTGAVSHFSKQRNMNNKRLPELPWKPDYFLYSTVGFSGAQSRDELHVQEHSVKHARHFTIDISADMKGDTPSEYDPTVSD